MLLRLYCIKDSCFDEWYILFQNQSSISRWSFNFKTELQLPDQVSISKSHFNLEIEARSWNRCSILESKIDFQIIWKLVKTQFWNWTLISKSKSILKLQTGLEFKAWFWNWNSILKSRINYLIKIRFCNQSLISKSKINFEIEDLFQNRKKFFSYIIYETDTKS